MKQSHKGQILNRLKTARGHLDGVVRMVDDEAYCPDIMKQLSAIQGSLERASRLVLRNHLETCVAEAMRAGRVDEIVDELMEALRYDRVATGPGVAVTTPGQVAPSAGVSAAGPSTTDLGPIPVDQAASPPSDQATEVATS